jgi:mannose/fructose-specific phosphotransferase system component IIA
VKTRIILISHGDLAKGMAHSAQMIAGATPDLFYYGLQPGEHPSQITKKIKNEIVTNPEYRFIIIVDIFGGSVCNQGMELLEFENVRLLSGMNLSLVIELLVSADMISDEDLKEKVSNAQRGIKMFSKSILAEQSEIEKEFF